MIRIFSAEQIRQADRFTIEHEPIPSVDLMERAADACVNWIKEKVTDVGIRFIIVCGPGNNGGDGLAIARMLIENKMQVSVFIPAAGHRYSDDFKVNLDRLRSIGVEAQYLENFRPADFNSRNCVLIDALFGSGLSKPVTGEFAETIDRINTCNARVIAVDIPSGLFVDKPSEPGHSHIVKADYTLSFQFPKLAFFMAENDEYVGHWEVLPIGLHPGFTEAEKTHYHLITEDDIRYLLKPRKKFSHKGTYGHAMLIAGSLGKIGAAVLASRACLRAGTGLVTAHIPRCGYVVMQSAVPEVMVSVSAGENNCSDIPELSPFSGLAIGPGLGTSDESRNALRLLIQEAKLPLVIDADGINILAQYKTWLSFLPPGSILTPHPGEFERITAKASNGYERLEFLKEFCFKNNAYVVLKGAHTAICTPQGNYFFNPTGNPGMATGGSGDVLTGIILGFMAQGYHQAEACILAVFLHGKAGDLAAGDKGLNSMIAGDIIEYLPQAFKFYE